MDRWKNRVAVVTGASSGIGAATVKDLLKAGMIVVGLARRRERLLQIRNSLPEELQSCFHPVTCDVTKESDIMKAFAWIEDNLGGPDVLINNAGVIRSTELINPNNTKEIKEIIDTNIMGVLYCTREAFNSMKTRNVNGHIVNINSITGHKVPFLGMQSKSGNMYPPTKFAITAMTETYRQEFQKAGTNVKISSISPGYVLTEIFSKVDEKKLANLQATMLRAEDVSSAILYVIGTPPNVQIHEMIIKHMGERF